MKILSLNTWGGRARHEGIVDFLKKHDEVSDHLALMVDFN